MKKYDIVVARYNENIDWLNNLKSDINLKIYNKGKDDINFEYSTLQNIGGDAHTYVSYIIENYYNLPEFVIFVQGHPFDHFNNLLDVINNHDDEPYVLLSDHVIDEPIVSWYEQLVNSTVILDGMKRYNLVDTASAILKNEKPPYCTFAAGQQFIINKKYILNRDLDFYKMIMDRFNFDYVLPWHLERLWVYIWKIEIKK